MSAPKSRSSSGIGIGAVIAVLLSWSANKSILWAIIHGVLGWVYVLYRVVGCGGDI
jgi:hypothetical protein